MWSSPQNIFSVTLASQKVGLDSRPVTLASIEVDNHEKMLNKYVIVPSKKNFLRDARLSQKWVSTVAPCHSSPLLLW